MTKISILTVSSLFAVGLAAMLKDRFEISDEPDVVLVSETLTKQGSTAYPNAKLVVIGERDIIIEDVAAMINSGASAYANAKINADQLATIIQLVAAGHEVWPRDILKQALEPKGGEAPSPAPDKWSKLSPKEATIILGLTHGLSNKQIALKTGIVESTVKVHVKAILRKLNLQNRTQAAMWAAQHHTGATTQC